MPTMNVTVTGSLYTLVLMALSAYALHIVILIALYLRHRHDPEPELTLPRGRDLPVVTVQIPLRNERYVVRRVLRAVAAFEWPRDRLEIQILDDSDDETTAIARAEATRLRAQGRSVKVLHRPQPMGHKAGALAEGLRQANGELVALFDADFVPQPDFLQRTVPYFLHNAQLGMVQARWEHLNAESSPITRAQALALDAHFAIEHVARNRSGLLMNFNGTAGVWRKSAIEDAGGWQHDTVAEDLDLSYRAQLRGWQMLFLPHVTAEAELPPLIAAFKQQQYRWAKGATQCLRKLARPILRSPRLNPVQKVMALLHLSGYFTQPLFLGLMMLLLPMAFFRPLLPPFSGILGAIIAVPPLLYLLGQKVLYQNWIRRALAYPMLMVLGMGMAWSNTLAIIDGLLHWGGAFHRTPKFHLSAHSHNWREASYRIKPDGATWGEGLLGLYVLGAAWVAYNHGELDLLPLACVAITGEAVMVGASLLQAHTNRGRQTTHGD